MRRKFKELSKPPELPVEVLVYLKDDRTDMFSGHFPKVARYIEGKWWGLNTPEWVELTEDTIDYCDRIWNGMVWCYPWDINDA